MQHWLAIFIPHMRAAGVEKMIQIFVGVEHLFSESNDTNLSPTTNQEFFPDLSSVFNSKLDLQSAICILISAVDPGLSSDLVAQLPEWLSIIIVNSSEECATRCPEAPRISFLSTHSNTSEIKNVIQNASQESARSKQRYLHQQEILIRLSQLTQRELEVVELVAGGLTTKMISGTLSISESTVDKHRRSAFKKLNIKNSIVEVLNLLIDVPKLLRISEHKERLGSGVCFHNEVSRIEEQCCLK